MTRQIAFQSLPPAATQTRRYSARNNVNKFDATWFGVSPSHWQHKRLKFSVRLVNVKVEPETTTGVYVGMENIESWTGRELPSEKPAEPDGLSCAFLEGDVLFGKLRPYLAKAWIATRSGICSSELLVMRPLGVSAPFLIYMLLCRDFINAVDSSTYGSKMPRASWGFIGNLPCLIPPDDEQSAIVAFLDRETTRIDHLIAEKTRLIERLAENRATVITQAVTKGLDSTAKTKSSGIDWLGAIPSHWSLTKLKYVSHLQTGLTLGKKYDAEERTRLVRRPYLRVANVQDGWLDLGEITEVEVPPDAVARYTLQAGDVLMTEGGDFDKLGRGYVWEGQIEECLHQNHIFAVRPKKNVLNSRLLASLMSSHHGRNYFTKTSQQTTNLASTNSTKLGCFPVPLPPIKEQFAIVDAISERSSHFDALTRDVTTAVDRLREYRSALITAAVTGRIDVRNTASSSDRIPAEAVL